jgi:hypothetical protein
MYDVRDLIADGHTVGDLKAADQPAPVEAETIDHEPADGAETAPENEPEAVPADAEPRNQPPHARTPGERLMWLLTDHVDPNAWINFGGDRAVISERGGVLIVTAPPSTHAKFREALRRLRTANPTGISFEAAIVELPRSVFQRLTRDFDAASTALGEAVLGARDGVTLWRASAAAAFGATALLTSENENLRATLELKPTFDRDTGMLRIELSATMQQGPDKRSARTAASFADKRGSAVIEMSPAQQTQPPQPADAVRVIVVVPRAM